MPPSLNKVTLITGASSGIGLELSHIFAKNGHDLILIARQADKLYEVADTIRNKYGIQVASFANDLSKMSEVQYVVDAIKSEGVFIEYLVNNAGVGDYGVFQKQDWIKIEHQINLNMKALTYLCHAFIPAMQEQKRGQILNIASTAAFRPGPLMAVYFASKAYVLSLSEALSNELKGSNVFVTAFCPGATETNFAQRAQATNSTLFRDKKLPSATQVAEKAFEAMMRRKQVAVPGFANNALIFIQRFAPRKLVTTITRVLTSED
jgi:uncharacterized protein